MKHTRASSPLGKCQAFHRISFRKADIPDHIMDITQQATHIISPVPGSQKALRPFLVIMEQPVAQSALLSQCHIQIVKADIIRHLLLRMFADNRVPVIPLLPNGQLVHPVVPDFIRSGQTKCGKAKQDDQQASRNKYFHRTLSFGKNLHRISRCKQNQKQDDKTDPDKIDIRIRLQLGLLIPFRINPVCQRNTNSQTNTDISQQHPSQKHSKRTRPFPPSAQKAHANHDQTVKCRQLASQTIDEKHTHHTIKQLHLHSPYTDKNIRE